MGGGDDVHVHGNRLRPTYPPKSLLLEHAQEFHLRVGRQIADLVEEERALVRLLEATDAPQVSARERAAFMAEELAFQQVVQTSCRCASRETCRRSAAWFEAYVPPCVGVWSRLTCLRGPFILGTTKRSGEVRRLREGDATTR